MAVKLFAGHREVPVSSMQAMYETAQAAVLLGHRVCWDPTGRALYIDSPLQGQRMSCGCVQTDDLLAGQRAWQELMTRLRSAGGVVVKDGESARRLDLDLRIAVNPSQGEPALEVTIWQHPWSRLRLGTALARYLRVATAVPVDLRVFYRWRRSPLVLVSLHPPKEEARREAWVLRGIEGLWQGLMSGFARGREVLLEDQLELIYLCQEWGQPEAAHTEVPLLVPVPGTAGSRVKPLYSWQWQRPLVSTTEVRARAAADVERRETSRP